MGALLARRSSGRMQLPIPSVERQLEIVAVDFDHEVRAFGQRVECSDKLVARVDSIRYLGDLDAKRLAARAGRRNDPVDEAVILEHHRPESAEDMVADKGRYRPQRVKALLEIVDIRHRGIPLRAAWRCRCNPSVTPHEASLELRFRLIRIHGDPPRG